VLTDRAQNAILTTSHLIIIYFKLLIRVSLHKVSCVIIIFKKLGSLINAVVTLEPPSILFITWSYLNTFRATNRMGLTQEYFICIHLELCRCQDLVTREAQTEYSPNPWFFTVEERSSLTAKSSKSYFDAKVKKFYYTPRQ